MTLELAALWALVIVPILPALASIALVRHWKEDSVTLHERTIIAFRDWGVGSIAALLSLETLFDWNWPTLLWVMTLYIGLLLMSIPSAYWLYLYLTGHFMPTPERVHQETPIEKEDREVGDTRRDLQAQAAEQEEKESS